MNSTELITFMYYIEQTQSDKSVSEFYDVWSRIYDEFEELIETDEQHR